MRIESFMTPVESYKQSLVNNDPIQKILDAKAEENSPVGQVKRGECQTCKNRKYQDGSDEMVSFKSAAHVAPEAAGSAVRAHEQEHVSNAYKKASQGNGKVLSATVTIHTGICPECGRTYVSGGVTNTKIAYSKGGKPDTSQMGKGRNFDAAV